MKKVWFIGLCVFVHLCMFLHITGAQYNENWLSSNGTYGNAVQSTYTLPLNLGIVPARLVIPPDSRSTPLVYTIFGFRLLLLIRPV